MYMDGVFCNMCVRFLCINNDRMNDYYYLRQALFVELNNTQ